MLTQTYLFKKDKTIPAKKFEVAVVTHAKDADEIKKALSSEGDRSDHKAIASDESIALTWNTLKRCHVDLDVSGKVLLTNNGYNKKEDFLTYKKRLEGNLIYIGQLAQALSKSSTQLPISVLCLQEVSTDVLKPEEIDALLKKNQFTIRAGKDSKSEEYLVKICTEKKNELLVTAYDPEKVKYIEICALPATISEIQIHENRILAVKFFDKTIEKEFVVVNVHQNSAAVNVAQDEAKSSSAVFDVAHLLEHFQKMNIACIVTGDFNTKTIPLSEEAGKMILNLNANIYWDLHSQSFQPDSCDHIIMNEKYYREFMPYLRVVMSQRLPALKV